MATSELTTTVEVVSRRMIASGVVELLLAREDGRALPMWSPGAHIDLVLPDGTSRQYSLCGDVGDLRTYRVAILEEPDGRGFSRRLHQEAVVGSTWTLRGPRSHFELAASPDYLFIAGGIGITPLLPMLHQADASGARWKLVYGGRRRASMAFVDELEQFEDRITISPESDHGLLPLDVWLADPRPDTLIYCCGPEPLLRAVEDATRHWPPGALRVERFSPVPSDDDTVDSPFEVELAMSDLVLTVPAGKSVLDVVREAGVRILSSCQAGTCGTCETPVIEGVPDHRDFVLNADERAANDYMMICVSRACTRRLVLDL
ncbi:PDR/VanB family oxidoreductase [Umezawaea tangerina]|uniref:Ferredoxin-NADP reductase n=1 Tax=Umezawaea tangerina TaxID=84725 RepID=A0A2T0T7I0_9PSEU|nr:PDR/VanB family oxidoreductase [Umezawaea tangerina]PRY41635.1 ferredoxin-NADP reductase [Umezawaea tangerina]